MNTTKDITVLQKKILYKAKYRGTKEGDVVIGGFVSDNINNFDEEYLLALDDFLELNDQNILTMIATRVCNDDKFKQIINDILEHKSK